MRAFLLEWDMECLIDVASRLQDELGWEVLVWSASANRREIVRERFPHALFHETLSSRLAVPPPGGEAIAAACVDESLATALAGAQAIALKMMDRVDAGQGLAYESRMRLFFDLVRYWDALLAKLCPDVAIFPTSPHVVYNYVAYELCKLRGVRTLVFDKTAIPGLVLRLERFENGCPALLEEYRRLADEHERSGTQAELSSRAEMHLRKLAGSYADAMPGHLRFKLSRVQGREKPLFDPRKLARIGRFPHYLRLLPGIVLRRLGLTRKPIFGRWRGRNLPMEGIGPLEEILFRQRVRRVRRKLERCYERLVREVDLERPYVYVALHCQPERSTSPNGGVFVYQELMVEMISKAAPPGWSVYVKEHVSQYKVYQAAERGRTTAMYETMAALPNVSLVPMSLPTFDLIDKARAVATVTGSVGWESAVRGVPVLVFGQAWYLGCDGVHDARTEEGCRNALAEIASGRKPGRELVRLFLQATERVGVSAYVDAVTERVCDIEPCENVAALVEAIRVAVNADVPSSDGGSGRARESREAVL